MPLKKKKLVKKKKIKESSSKTPNLRNRDKYQNLLLVTGAEKSTTEKRPSTSYSCKFNSSVAFPKIKNNKNKISLTHFKVLTTKEAINKNLKRVVTDRKTTVTNKNSDNVGLKRILTPFNRFANSFTRTADLNKYKIRMPYESSYRHIGLSPKEKSYLISTCQTRSSRYLKLKNMATIAIRDNKIFTVCGNCNAVRKALVERGWIEKIPPNKMNLSKIRNGNYSGKDDILNELERLLLSNMVEKYPTNFIWQTTEEQHGTTTINMKQNFVIINKLKIDALWTSKQGLCSSVKRNYWFYIENEAEVNVPRTYNSYDAGEIEGFVKDFHITACTSLLKWVLSMVANERPVFVKTGKISMKVLIFALNRCKEYLFRKQNKDIDRSIQTASTSQWNAFLKQYYRIIAKNDVFTSDTDNRLSFYMDYAQFLLKEMYKYRPQLSCEGCHNIWIMKPAHCSRGRGIRMASKLAVIKDLINKTNSKYVIQKYIEEPLLIYDTKFDIRQYYLVTSTYPLVIWMYQNCYLKFSSQKYNLKNYHEAIHLTNNAVQKKYKNSIGRHYDLPQSNMWDLEKYKNYLNNIGRHKVWDNIIYPGMKKTIIGIMLSCQDSLPVSKNRFELYGCDFILDKEYKPWLIEINSCPDLNATTAVTAKICPAVISDIIKVVIDHANDSKSSTGNFECIYRQPMTMPKYGGAADLFARGFALRNDYFFKGNIEIKESFYDVDVEKEQCFKSVLSKLKRVHDTNVMVTPDDDFECSSKKEIYTQNTESEYELSRAASIVTEQLDELIGRIDSEHTRSTKSMLFQESTNSSHNIPRTQSTKSENNIKSLMTLGNHFASTEAIKNSNFFGFSQLEEGHSERGSTADFKSLKRAMQCTSNALNQSLTGVDTVLIHSYDGLQATTKIVSFLKEKQQETFPS